MLPLLFALAAVPPATAPPPTPGTVVVRLADESVDDDYNDDAFVAAVARAFTDHSFVELPDQGPSRYLAEVKVERHARGAALAPVGRSRVGVGGAGVIVPLRTGKQRVGELIVTELTVRLFTRTDGALAWQGSALTIQVDGTRADDPYALARKLAPVVVARFPLATTGPVSVP